MLLFLFRLCCPKRKDKILGLNSLFRLFLFMFFILMLFLSFVSTVVENLLL